MPDTYISHIDFGDGVVRTIKDPNASGGGGSLSELSDVNLTNPSSEQIIKYNATSQKWENSNLPLIMITVLPSTTDEFTYDGTEKTPTWTNYSTNQLLIGGDVSATNAGTHTTTFTPKAGFCWDDYSTTPRSVTWTISKAEGSISLNKNSVVLNSKKLTDIVTIVNATGTISSVTSSDSSIVSVSLNNNEISLTAENTSDNNDVTITISAEASTNYLSTSTTIAVFTRFIIICGVEWDGSETTVLSRTDYSVEFTDPIPYSPNMSGTPSSPFDDIEPWSSITKETDENGNVWVKIPKFYYKWTFNSPALKLQIASNQQEGYNVSPAHANRGDGQGERDFVYVSRYPARNADYKSITNSALRTSIDTSNIRSRIHNLGTDIWCYDYAMYMTIWMLYLVEYADWNMVAKIGSSSPKYSGYSCYSGHTDDMPYHTGYMNVTPSSPDYTSKVNQYRNIEFITPPSTGFIDGIWFNATSYSSAQSMYLRNNPADYTDSIAGATLVGSLSYVEDKYVIPKGLNESENSAYNYVIVPKSNSSQSTHDAYMASRISQGTDATYWPKKYTQRANGGMWDGYINYITGGSSSTMLRLQKLPNNS